MCICMDIATTHMDIAQWANSVKILHTGDTHSLN